MTPSPYKVPMKLQQGSGCMEYEANILGETTKDNFGLILVSNLEMLIESLKMREFVPEIPLL